MEYRLCEIFDLQMGKTPDRNKSAYWSDGTEEWISIADLGKSDKYISTTKEKISKCAIENSGIKAIPPNTVVMSFKLSIGKVAITKKQMYSNEAIMSFHDKNVIMIDPSYVYYLFLGQNWDEGTNKAVMGKTLNKVILSEKIIKVHSFEEQKYIVNILDRVMKLIKREKEQIELLDILIKSRFVV